MASFSDWAEEQALKLVLKIGAFAQPTNLYVGLTTVAISDTDTGSTVTEPAGNGYARVLANTWDAAAARGSANTSQVEFPIATGTWGTVTDFFIADAATLGNIIGYGAITPTPVAVDDTVRFEAGAITVSMNSGGWSDYLANAMVDHILKNTAYTAAPNLYTALATAAIGDSSTGSTITEPSGNAYARVIHNAWDDPTGSGGVSANSSEIAFAPATGAWGTISDTCLCDAATLGNMLIYGSVDTPKAVNNGDTAKFAAGQFDITLD